MFTCLILTGLLNSSISGFLLFDRFVKNLCLSMVSRIGDFVSLLGDIELFVSAVWFFKIAKVKIGKSQLLIILTDELVLVIRWYFYQIIAWKWYIICIFNVLSFILDISWVIQWLKYFHIRCWILSKIVKSRQILTFWILSKVISVV